MACVQNEEQKAQEALEIMKSLEEVLTQHQRMRQKIQAEVVRVWLLQPVVEQTVARCRHRESRRVPRAAGQSRLDRVARVARARMAHAERVGAL